MQMYLRRTGGEVARGGEERKRRRSTVTNTFPLPGRGLVFTITAAAPAHIEWSRFEFHDHSVTGDGNDDIGRLFVIGRLDYTSGECHWTKTYIGAHDVYYRGFREGKGIWGLWELLNESGGFHILPVGEQEGEQGQESAEESRHFEAIVGQSDCAFARNIAHRSANRIGPIPAAMSSRDREQEHCPRPLYLHVKNHTRRLLLTN